MKFTRTLLKNWKNWKNKKRGLYKSLKKKYLHRGYNKPQKIIYKRGYFYYEKNNNKYVNIFKFSRLYARARKQKS